MNTIVFPCPNSVDCPGSDLPVTNFSSEAIDGPLFIGLFWGSQGLGICESPVDQETALLCAARDNCIVNVAPRFFNNPQTGITFCGDASPFAFTVPAGLFCADTQALADAEALSYAQLKAQQRMFCVVCPLVPPGLIVGQNYSGQFGTTGAATSATYSVIGSMPPGLTLSPSGLVSGTIMQTQNEFFVQAIDQNGDFMVKGCSINATGLQPICPDPGTCPPGTCWNTQQCLCIGYGNDAVSGSIACPCNGLITVSGSIPKCTYQSANAGDYPTVLNQQANTALAALLLQALGNVGCSGISISGSTVTNLSGCTVTFGVFHTDGTFYDPTYHTISVAPHSAVEWCSFLHGVTGSDPFGSGYFDLGGGVKSYFSCPHIP
jgi:hypothetical protein